MSSAECISPDGNYIAGYGIDNFTFNYFSYRLKIGNGTTGVQSVSENDIVKIYPSPSSGIFTVDCAVKGLMTIRSIDGKVVLRSSLTQKQTVDISKYESGLYTVLIESENSLYVKKIIKQ
jgi:hypothetical protein